MILYPAIDLKGGACVRLVRGEMASATVFNDDPAAQAGYFAAMGFGWLHVVDLDGAFAGRSVNGEAVRGDPPRASTSRSSSAAASATAPRSTIGSISASIASCSAP